MLIMELFNFIDRGAGGVIVIIFHPMKLHCALAAIVIYAVISLIRVSLALLSTTNAIYFSSKGAICYMPIASPGSIRGPHPPRFVPYPINPGTAMFLPETVALRFNIVKQIEYYFSFVV
ncbi:uncharacterized protein LOC111285289 isoform X2 [Durio zibethinus]|uniref:Uncharacterized protein LOC111285289 isoform X2 n=1 Tax=Durio zibethinus TaxID=66656 RepID=A0A6P5XR63_DURZI|nr:uncharacterized protein LOC111285289 isoform X2 [Durio zibethinus]